MPWCLRGRWCRRLRLPELEVDIYSDRGTDQTLWFLLWIGNVRLEKPRHSTVGWRGMATDRNGLALPAGSQRIFDEVVPLILEFVPPERLLLGGGTALAARWQHRDSFDIDLFTAPSTYTEAIYDQSSRFEARLEELPGSRILTLGLEGCTVYCEHGRVEIVASSPQTRHGRSQDSTCDPMIALETNVEILAKKLHRRMLSHGRIVPRDLYDMAVARRLEPEALEEAWSAGPVRDPAVLVAALSSFSPGWMERHEEPVANPHYPELRDSAVQDMLDDVRSRFPRTSIPWRQ